ncbi:MAG: NADP-dependent isocitrate dehydrogenase [Simkaniaceae bacterium]|nr:NADP-dependent isocitrate dehydrogenase [Simkaniaceae bacterium]
MKTPITVARGDGIGPEITAVTLRLLEAAGASLEIHEVEMGEKVYLKGIPTGITTETWDVIRKSKAFLKAPMTTPQGGGFKSLNVTIRTTLGLYANIRPCISYSPFVRTKHPNMDVVIIRENEEDLYAGIEYRQTPNVCESIKLISRAGSEKICRYAFEYAKQHGRKKVTCFAKDNIMKFSDGLFRQAFDEVAKDYPSIENEYWIVDIGAAKLADTPEAFDVIVLPNLYGDILSDVAAQISGSVGLVGSANIGTQGSMFEAIHGSAPRRAGQNMANPSAMILASVLMLHHIGQSPIAALIHNAWLKTIEDGIHTYDLFAEGVSKQKVGTKEFGDAVIQRLGKKPTTLHPVSDKAQTATATHGHTTPLNPKRELIGVDVYFYGKELAEELTHHSTAGFELKYVGNRGARLFPEGQKETFCIEQWRYRFLKKGGCTGHEIATLLGELSKKYDIIKTENLYLFDGKPGFTNAQDHEI